MKNLFPYGLAALVTLPGLYFRLSGIHPEPGVAAAVFGVAILGAGFLLSWAGEAAEVDISQGLAVAFLALVTVLPEYAVDLVFAWKAADDPQYAHYATANMTGANRLLIGIGWPLIVGLFWWRSREKVLHLEREHALELGILAVATIYAFTLPFKHSLTLYDTLIMVSFFAVYMFLLVRAPAEPPELTGPARVIGSLPTRARRFWLITLFVFSAAVIFAAAEPFADGLVETGLKLGIDEFLLVQWLAPLASESPEVIVAVLFVLRLRSTAAMGTLISAKVNQWTLLLGTLALVYSISRGQFDALPLDSRQQEEILLTAAQSIFAVAILARLRFSLWAALALLVLFSTQLFFTDQTIRYGYAIGYIVLTVAILVADFKRLPSFIGLFRNAVTMHLRPEQWEALGGSERHAEADAGAATRHSHHEGERRGLS